MSWLWMIKVLFLALAVQAQGARPPHQHQAGSGRYGGRALPGSYRTAAATP